MKTINFFHLERGGGNTMRDILVRQYNHIYNIRQFKDYDKRYKDLKVMSNDEKKKIELIVGHQYFGIHKLLPQEMQYFTLLREPIQKIVSAYQYYRRTVDSPYHNIANEYSLESILLNELKLHFNNGYVRCLAFEHPSDEIEYGRITEEHYQLAKKRIDKYFIAGVTDLYDEMLVYLYERLGWRKYPLYTKANFAKPQHLIKSPTWMVMNLIQEHNKWDIKLYNYVKRQFMSLLVDAGPGYYLKVDKFRTLNRSVGRIFIGQRLKRMIKRAIS